MGKCSFLSLSSTFCLAISISILPAFTMADDTEIYFGQQGEQLRHNLLFILDTSGSMQRAVRIDDNNDGDTSDPGENRGSRISILRQVMNDTVSGLDNLNVGYMRMNGARFAGRGGASLDCNPTLLSAGAQDYGVNNVRRANQANACYVPTGGTVLFPVYDLDEALTNVPGVSGEVLSVPIISNTDDAQQQVGASPAQLNTTDSILDIGAGQCPAANVQTMNYTITSTGNDAYQPLGGTPISATPQVILGGTIISFFRFQNIAIPQGAYIVNASLNFTLFGASNTNIDLSITAATNADSTMVPSTLVNDAIVNLNRTNATVSWTGTPNLPAGDVMTSPDVSDLIQELVNDNGWSGKAISFIMSGNSPGTGLSVNGFGGPEPSPATLSITYCDNVALSPTRQQVGLRFQNVLIPQGADISSAFVSFRAASAGLNTTGNTGSQVTIRAHDVDDSDTFSATVGNDLESRVMTSANAIWTDQQMGDWVNGNTYSTIDISDVVEQVTERNGWCGGNDMSLVFTGDNLDLLRRALSYDDDPANAPVLRVQYRDLYDSDDNGCNQRTFTLPITRGNHQAVQRVNFSGNGFSVMAGPPDLTVSGFSGRAIMGLIFSLPIESNTIINSALLRLTLNFRLENITSANPNVQISAQNTINANVFNSSDSIDPTVRPRISGSGVPVSWSVPGGNDRTAVEVDISPLISAVISQSGWKSGNNIALFLRELTRTTNRRVFYSFSSPSRAPRLTINVQENRSTLTPRTVRDALLNISQSFNSNSLLGWTPSVETLFEAALYWRGSEVRFGRTRGSAIIDGGDGVVGNLLLDGIGSRLGNVDFKLDMHRTLTSHPGSWEGGNYNEPAGRSPGQVSCQFSNNPDCVQDSITGNAVYRSPINQENGECARNYQIFLTDGVPTWTNDSTVSEIISEFDNISGCSIDPTVNARGIRGRCAVEMITDMNNNDQSTLSGRQTINTHTIAFNLDDMTAVEWLQQLADAGGGRFFSADDVTQLQTVFDIIINELIRQPSSFSSPAISANAFNRLFTRNEIYLGLFEPELSAKWDGNLKKYNICDRVDQNADGNPDCTLGDILDANFNLAVDNGVFRENSTSVWSNQQDGRVLRSGGAGAEVININQRTIYTDLNNLGATTSALLSADGYRINSTNWNSSSSPDLSHIRALVCPDPSDLSAGSDCRDRMLWLLGQDSRDEDEDGNFTELRWWFSDILHSSPVAVTYGIDNMNAGPADDEFIDKILVGTNQGAIHMINGNNGREEWSFIPNELLGNQIALYNNDTANHIYGMDLTPTVRIVDQNNNGIIEPATDRVHAYFGMRRGGLSYYALDLTPANILTSVSSRITPRLLWTIRGGTTSTQGDFSRLTQTWSEPVSANIRCTVNTNCPNGSVDVLIFGGGYDGRLDNGDFGLAAAAPNFGNAIYIVDAERGDLIIWISHAAAAATTDNPSGIMASDADIQVPDMYYSIMSKLTVMDSNFDGFEDRIYAGDAGGQVWRVDLGSDIEIGSASPEGGTVVGKLAEISTAGVADAERRFHYSPVVAQVSDSIYSNAPGGAYDYVVIASGDRAHPVNTDVQDRLYAFRDYHINPMTGVNGLANSYPRGTFGNQPITEANMTDITQRILDPEDSNHLGSFGWYYRFDTNGSVNGNNGQKGISPPLIAAGNVFLTSYLPADRTSPETPACGALTGSGFVHHFNLLSTAATLDWNGDGDINAVTDRSQTLSTGIPSGAIPIFTREGVTLSVGTGEGPENLGVITDLPRYRTYWGEDAPAF